MGPMTACSQHSSNHALTPRLPLSCRHVGPLSAKGTRYLRQPHMDRLTGSHTIWLQQLAVVEMRAPGLGRCQGSGPQSSSSSERSRPGLQTMCRWEFPSRRASTTSSRSRGPGLPPLRVQIMGKPGFPNRGASSSNSHSHSSRSRRAGRPWLRPALRWQCGQPRPL